LVTQEKIQSKHKETSMKLDNPMRRLTLALIAGLACSAPAWAQTWPAKPIRLVVNFAPGGAADVIARALGPQLSQALKQPVVIDNKPGAGGNLGSGEVAKSANDGYTLLMSSGGAITINPLIYNKMGFDPEKDLVSVASVARVLVFLEAHPSVPASNVQEFITYARANPGKLSFGSPGQGSSPHLAGEMLKRMAKIDATHVPYKGAGPALTDVLGGQLQFWFDPGPGLKHVKEGKLKLLAVGSSKRSPQYPDVPTLSESGLAGFDADSIFGIYAPAGTPSTVVAQLHSEINKALALPAVADAIKALGAEPAAMGRDEFIGRHAKERERFGGLVKDIGLKVD
jgi:tripartite-type tricarboxylate transporter receptor subunit TctC